MGAILNVVAGEGLSEKGMSSRDPDKMTERAMGYQGRAWPRQWGQQVQRL